MVISSIILTIYAKDCLMMPKEQESKSRDLFSANPNFDHCSMPKSTTRWIKVSVFKSLFQFLLYIYVTVFIN